MGRSPGRHSEGDRACPVDPVNNGAEHPGDCSLVVNCDLSGLLTTDCSSEMKHLQTNDNHITLHCIMPRVFLYPV